MSNTKAELTLNGVRVTDLDILSPTLGQPVVDVRTLGGKGYYTFDPASPPLRPVNQRSRISTVMKVSCYIAASRLKSWR